MLTLLLAALPLVSPAAPAPRAQDAQAEPVLDASTLSDEIDRSLRWLRGRFDASTGSFGSLEADAWAVLAFASSPRAYVPSDGPFVGKPVERLKAARAEVEAAARTASDPAGAERQLELVLTAALMRAGELELQPLEPLPGTEPGTWTRIHGWRSPPPQLADAHARELLAARNADGSFGDGDARVLETARRIEELSACHAALKAAERAKKVGAAHALPRFDKAQRKDVQQSLMRGARYLLDQRIDGGWGFDGRRDAGITAMVAGALLAMPAPRPAQVEKAAGEALDWLVGLQNEDGSIHEGQLANYVTSAAVMALARAGREKDAPVVARAASFLKNLQADEGEGYSEGDRFYGGMGYGGDERPDLSNLQMALEALHDAGTPSDDPAFQKALAFLQRCQNRSESNDLALTIDGTTYASGNDGGSGYAPGDSKAGFVELADGTKVPRSYGSMSYALLKGYLFAGLSRDDPRVQAVWKWLRENYTLDVNPGFEASSDPTAAYQGLFYYFLTMARALDLYGEATITDGAGREHDWRGELCGRLLAMQRQDGSWLNENAARWFEGNPVLATSYAMLTLGTALP